MADAITNVIDTVTNAIKGFVNLDAETTAKVLGVWSAARAVVSTVAGGIAEVVTYETVRNIQAQHLDKQLTPAVLADMVVRNIIASDSSGGTKPLLGNIDGHDVYAEAAFSGIDKQRLDALILDTGESYGILDALRLYNRGLSMPALSPVQGYPNTLPLYHSTGNQATEYGITQAELNTVIHYSRVRDQFIPDLLKLARNTLTPADAVELALKDVLSKADAKSLFVAGGGVPEQFDVLVDGAGDAIGVEKAVELAAHKVISMDTLNAVVHMSRMNPRFYPLAEPAADGTIPLHHKWLPPFEIKEAAAAGVITHAQALQWMLDEGYDADQAKAFSASLGATTVTKAKQETESMVLEEFSAGLITQADMETALTNLGYTPASIPFLTQYATAKRVIAARNTALSRVRQGYLAGLTTADQATNEMSQIGIGSTAIQAYLADWTAELAIPHTALTVAEIGWFVEHAVITLAEGEHLWKLRGLTAADVALMGQRYPPPAAPPPTAPPGAGGF